MAVNSNPPIVIDPSMDDGHRLTFINQNFHSLADSLNPYTLSDGSNDRLLIGKDSNGDYVVKVSQPGFNAYDATDEQLIFNSEQDIFKIVGKFTGTFSFTTGSGETTASVTVNHNLGYVPQRTSFVTGSLLYISPTSAPLPLVIPGSATATGLNLVLVVADVLADTTKIQYSVSIFAGAGNAISGTITTYILQETAN